LLALLLAASCHRQAPAPSPRKQAAPASTSSSQARTTVAQPEAKSTPDDAAGAADLLKRYYALIEAGRYEDAWRMRSGGRGLDENQFAAHFKAYEAYHPQVG